MAVAQIWIGIVKIRGVVLELQCNNEGRVRAVVVAVHRECCTEQGMGRCYIK